MPEPQIEQPEPEPQTIEFDVLHADLSLKVPIRSAPNPLRTARPERMEVVRQEVDRIVAARRAGVAPHEL